MDAHETRELPDQPADKPDETVTITETGTYEVRRISRNGVTQEIEHRTVVREVKRRPPTNPGGTAP